MDERVPVGSETVEQSVEASAPVAVASTPYIRPIPEDDRAGRNRRLLPIILLLLLLCCCAGTLLGGFGQSGILGERADLRAQFIVRNAECLTCHSDMIDRMSWPSVHEPFGKESCLSCHTPHGGDVTVVTSSGGVVEFQGTTWWDSMLRGLFGADSWVAKKLGTGSGSFWWWLFGDHPASLYNRVVSWFEWLPLRIFGGGPDGSGGILVSPWKRPVSSAGTSEAVGIAAGEAGLILPLDELCLMCHQGVASTMHSAFPHKPVIDGQCTSCHDPHASRHGDLLHADTGTLCMSCHGGDGSLQFGLMSTHGPFQNLECTSCHAAHGSNFGGMLVQAERPLCFSCHSGIASLTSKAVQHAPFSNQPCSTCHDPHSSNFNSLLHMSETQLCYSCHPQIRNEFNQPSHHPIGFGDMGCSTCHDPHASDHSGLLHEDATSLCGSCHRALNARMQRDAHFQVPCTRCHAAHGSAWAPMLTASNPDLCLQCHSRYDERDASGRINNHPVRPHWYDVHSGKRLTCTTTCHDPHGTPRNYLLKQYSWPYDGNCVICHQTVPGWQVGEDY